MTLTENQDYAIYDSGLLMNSKQPMQRIDVCTLSTKNYVFLIPKKTTGMFLLFDTIKTHQLFEGVTIEQGVRKLIAKAENVTDLEKSMIALLQDDEKHVHQIASKSKFKFSGFLGKHTLMMRTSMTNYSSILVNGKGESKRFRLFHGQ